MKRFQFSLETVLDYKQQVLSALQTEHTQILAQLRAQEEVLQGLEEQYRETDNQFYSQKMEGIGIGAALGYERYLRVMERKMQDEQRHLERLKRQEEDKRSQVVAARQDTSSLEKLREKKLESYHKAVQKGEEAMIDEMVSAARIMAGSVVH
jgi:flagellar FliJ protein